MYEYKVVAGPQEPGKSFLGRAKSTYADALSVILNEQGLDDWEYQRSETGPDSQRLLIFRRQVRKLEEDLPGITMHAPPEPERIDVRPRPARALLDEDRETIERVKAARRKIVVEKSTEEAGADPEAQPANNVADLLAAKIAKAQGQRETSD